MVNDLRFDIVCYAILYCWLRSSTLLNLHCSPHFLWGTCCSILKLTVLINYITCIWDLHISNNNIVDIYQTTLVLLFKIMTRVHDLLPCMRNTQIISVVYGGTFDSIHLYCFHSIKDHQACSNLKYNNIKYHILLNMILIYTGRYI